MNRNSIFEEIDQKIRENKKDNNMAIYQRLTITLHPIEIEKLDELAKEHQETRSGMIRRLIQEHK